MDDLCLSDLREQLNMTQESVASLCGISRAYYTMIENGKRKPSVKIAKRIASVLKFNWPLFFKLDGNDSLHYDKEVV